MTFLRTNRIIVLVAIGFCLVAASLAVLRTRTPQFTDFPEALQYQISQRGVAVEHVYLSRGFADMLTDEVFSANLSVELAGGEALPGRIECKLGRTRCHFTVREVGIYRQPLPDLATVRPIAWLDWLEAQIGRFGL
jgi:hypothetical protein